MKGFYLTPKFFTILKKYSKDQLVKDIIAGIIVAIIALPLSIALALASGVEPAAGVYTAILGANYSVYGQVVECHQLIANRKHIELLKLRCRTYHGIAHKHIEFYTLALCDA